MEYICRIFKSTENLLALVWNVKGLQLPLFDVYGKEASSGNPGYTVYFYKEDRYTVNLIAVNPPKKLTEKQLHIINSNWNYCIQNDLWELEFEI